MYHIFISYSRKDLITARRIVNTLKELKLDTWFDWDSIPKGEAWEQEIYRGIEEADVLLFLISPDSVQSEMCNKEVLHAIRNNKRILPVLLREVGSAVYWDRTAGEKINSLNWIFCREERDLFPEAIDQVEKTIRTDYDWVRFHTSLQIKALAWGSKNDNSRLLRGKELKEAEDRIVKIGPRTEPALTEIQKQFLRASRKTYSGQRRRPFTVVTGVVSAFVLLGLWMTGVVYRLFPTQPGCPDISNLHIVLNTEDLSSDAQLVLEKARTKSMVQTTLRECGDGSEAVNAELTVVAKSDGSGDSIWLEVHLPNVPAFELDFLSEVRDFEPERVTTQQASLVIQAAAAYSLGDYEASVSILERMANGQEMPEIGSILMAQSNLFLNHLNESQSAYETALENAQAGSELASHLHMGAALAYWRPRLYHSTEGTDCAKAAAHYRLADPQIEGAALLNNVMILFADQYQCNVTDWQTLTEQEDAGDPTANAIASFIRAKRCEEQKDAPGCDIPSDLKQAEPFLMIARAHLLRYYYNNSKTQEICQTAEKYLESYQNDIISPLENSELRRINQLKGLSCT